MEDEKRNESNYIEVNSEMEFYVKCLVNHCDLEPESFNSFLDYLNYEIERNDLSDESSNTAEPVDDPLSLVPQVKNLSDEISEIAQNEVNENNPTDLGGRGAEGGNPDLNQRNQDPTTDSTNVQTNQSAPGNHEIIPKKKLFSTRKRGRRRNNEEEPEYRTHSSKDADNQKIMIKTSCTRSIFHFLTKKIKRWRVNVPSIILNNWEQEGIDLIKFYEVNLDELKMVRSSKDEDSLLWLNSTVEDLFKSAKLWKKGTPKLIYDSENYYEKIFKKIKEFQNDKETEKLIKFLNTKVLVLYPMYCGKIRHYKQFKILKEVLTEEKKGQEFEKNCRKNAEHIFKLAEKLWCYQKKYPDLGINDIIEKIESE